MALMGVWGNAAEVSAIVIVQVASRLAVTCFSTVEKRCGIVSRTECCFEAIEQTVNAHHLKKHLTLLNGANSAVVTI